MKAPLVDPDAPVSLETKDGRVFVQLPSSQEAEQIVHRARKRLSDLPAIPDTSNPVACVVAYELFGLAIEDIAIAMGISVAQVNTIKSHDAYKALKRQIVENIQESGKEEVVELFKSKRMSAAHRLVEMIDNPRPAIAMKASERVLEASGVSLSAEKKGKDDPMRSGLTIVYIDGDKPEKVVPAMEIAID